MMTRRSFLAALSAAGLATGTTGWLGSRLFAMVQDGSLPKPSGLGIEKWVKTTCGSCPAGCGLDLRFVDGLPVGLRGNPANPGSLGGLCPAGHATLWDLLAGDRIRSPLRRTGKRGAGSWEEISWEEALDTLASRLDRLKSKGSPEQFAVLENGTDPLRSYWIDRVMGAFGSPNRVVMEDPAALWNAAVAELVGPKPGPLVPDFASAEGIVSFGHELFETDGHPVWQSKMWGRMRAPEKDRLTPLIYVGPRQSPSAFKADLWLPCRPGTEGTVALGLCYALLQERWLHEDGIPGPSREDWRDLQLWLRKSFHPEVVETVSGVSSGLLFRAARTLHPDKRQSLALVGSAPLIGPAGQGAARGVALLNLLLGALGRSGGWLPSPEIPIRLADFSLPPTAKARLDDARYGSDGLAVQAPGRFWTALAEGRSYPVDTLLVAGANPLRELPDPVMIGRALDRADFLAVTACRMNETADRADLVLPQSTVLESWGLHGSGRLLPQSVVSLRQPVIPPRQGSKPFEAFWFDLARKMETLGEGIVPDSPESAIKEMALGLYESGAGAVPDRPEDLAAIEFMESRGWSAGGGADSFEAFWKRFRASGVWYQPAGNTASAGALPHAEFRLPSEKSRREIEWLSSEDLGGRSSRAFQGNSPEDVHLMISDSNTLWKGRTAETPLMMEMASFRSGRGWETICEVNPLTAEGLGLGHGDPAVLETATGSIRVRIRIVPTVPPRAVAVTRGLSESRTQDPGESRRGNPMELVPFVVDESTGGWVLAADVRLKADI